MVEESLFDVVPVSQRSGHALRNMQLEVSFDVCIGLLVDLTTELDVCDGAGDLEGTVSGFTLT